jgi:hypothetical protein
MPVAAKIAALLTGVSRDQQEMSPTARQQLCDQCERVFRIIQTERIVADAKKATAAKPKAGFFDDISSCGWASGWPAAR